MLFEQEPGVTETQVPNPTPDDVRRAMEDMEADRGSLLTISADLGNPDYAVFSIGATTEGFLVAFQSGWNAGGANYSFVGDPTATGTRTCVVGGQLVSGHEARYFATFDQALGAAQDYLTTFTIDPTSGWERTT